MSGARWRMAAVVSAVVARHIVVLLAAATGPLERPAASGRPDLGATRDALYTAATEFTQKAPNKGHLTKELDVEGRSRGPRLRLQGAASRRQPARLSGEIPILPPTRNGAGSRGRCRSRRKWRGPSRGAEGGSTSSVRRQLPPQIQPVQKPKLAFERCGRRSDAGPRHDGEPQMPTRRVQDAIRRIRGGTPGAGRGGRSGRAEAEYGTGMNLPPSAGGQRSRRAEERPDGGGFPAVPDAGSGDDPAELVCGVSGERETGKAGQGGAAVLDREDRGGDEDRVLRNRGEPLDRAAVAAISASNPLPPLPGEFKGDRIVLQLNFSTTCRGNRLKTSPPRATDRRS